MSHPDDIETKIIETVTRVADQREGRRPSTMNLIIALGELGVASGFYVCGKGCKRFGKDGQGGWLYDLVWLKQAKDGLIEDIPLILESELQGADDKNVNEDFMKLLIGRARHRVMIFRHIGGAERRFESFTDQVKLCTLTAPGDRYLFLGWSDTGGKLECKVLVA
jgi:hypothetical protein